MTGQKLIVVVGATGYQGGSVVRTFLAEPGWKVRAITRNASSSKAQALQAKGAEIAEANLNDLASLQKAFEGAHAVFGVTDFWTLFGDQSTQSLLKPGQALTDLCYELEVQQGKNIFDAAAGVPTLERLIYSSLPNVTKISKGKYLFGRHFDAKAVGAEHGEQAHPELWKKTSIVQIGFYLTNLSDHPILRPNKNVETGAWEYREVSKKSHDFVAAETDTGIVVKALIASPPGKNVAVWRERMPLVEYIKKWTEITGLPATTVVDNFSQMPPEFQQMMESVFGFATEYGMFGEKADKTVITVKDLEPPVELGTVDEWIRAKDWSEFA